MSTPSDPTPATLQLVSFSIANETFGINILNVQEIIRLVEITRVPNSLPHVEGVINLRGQIVSVVDLRTRLGIARQAPSTQTRIMVVECDDKTVGFLVDEVRQVLRISNAVIESTPTLTTHADAQYVRGVAKLDDTLLTLLDPHELLVTEPAALPESGA